METLARRLVPLMSTERDAKTLADIRSRGGEGRQHRSNTCWMGRTIQQEGAATPSPPWTRGGWSFCARELMFAQGNGASELRAGR